MIAKTDGRVNENYVRNNSYFKGGVLSMRWTEEWNGGVKNGAVDRRMEWWAEGWNGGVKNGSVG